MANYIKVRPCVARRLGVLETRFRYADGGVQLWEKDLAGVDKGWVFRKEETVARIGGVLFNPYENKDEQSRPAAECTPLPLALDPEWMPREGDEGYDGPSDAQDGTAPEPSGEEPGEDFAAEGVEGEEGGAQ